MGEKLDPDQADVASQDPADISVFRSGGCTMKIRLVSSLAFMERLAGMCIRRLTES